MLEARKEYKFCLNRNQLLDFKTNFKNQLFKLYPLRDISSLYMDTIDLKIYEESLLNDTEKYKYRYRKNTDGNISLEIKFNNQNGKFKYKEKTTFKSFSDIKHSIYENRVLYPSLLVDYKREYYKIEDFVRVTIDSDIRFTSTSNRSLSKLSEKEELIILEYKILRKDFIEIENYFIKNPVAYSKYNIGIEKVYKKY